MGQAVTLGGNKMSRSFKSSAFRTLLVSTSVLGLAVGSGAVGKLIIRDTRAHPARP